MNNKDRAQQLTMELVQLIRVVVAESVAKSQAQPGEEHRLSVQEARFQDALYDYIEYRSGK